MPMSAIYASAFDYGCRFSAAIDYFASGAAGYILLIRYAFFFFFRHDGASTPFRYWLRVSGASDMPSTSARHDAAMSC